MDNHRLLRILVEEIIRSPSRQAEIREARALYGNGFEIALQAFRRQGYVSDGSRPGHVILTEAGLAALRDKEQFPIAGGDVSAMTWR